MAVKGIPRCGRGFGKGLFSDGRDGRPTRDQPCLIGQRNTSALTVALQDLFKALYHRVVHFA